MLNQLYVASGHPVDYATGQTSFSGSQVKGWYAEMQAGDTLGMYWATQLFDFVFIAAVFAIAALAATYLARVNRSPRGRGSALWAAGAIGTGAGFDVAENLLSFVMLASPQGFPDFIAVPYSAMAVAKFVCLGSGVILLVASLIPGAANLVSRLASRRSNLGGAAA